MPIHPDKTEHDGIRFLWEDASLVSLKTLSIIILCATPTARSHSVRTKLNSNIYFLRKCVFWGFPSPSEREKQQLVGWFSVCDTPATADLPNGIGQGEQVKHRTASRRIFASTTKFYKVKQTKFCISGMLP